MRGSLTITTKYFTIWTAKGTKIVNKKTRATLKAGTYTVKTVVTYKAKKRSGGYYAAKTVKRAQTLTIATSTATCATLADAGRVKSGDSKQTVADTLHSTGALDWSTSSGGVLYETYRYAYCGSGVQWVWVSFADGAVTDSWAE